MQLKQAMEKQESKDRFPTFPQPRRLRSTFSYGIRILGARSKESCMNPPIHPEIPPHTQIPGRTSGFLVCRTVSHDWGSLCSVGAGRGRTESDRGDPEKKQVDLHL